MFWDKVSAHSAWIDSLPRVALPFLGCGFARGWLWWALSFMTRSASMPYMDAHTGHLLFDLGEIVGFLVLALLAFRFSPFVKRPTVLVVSLTLTLGCGAMIVAAQLAGIPSAVGLPLVFGGGFGYAFLLLLWLELYGCLNTRDMLLAWTGSYFVALVCWAVYVQIPTVGSHVVTALLPILSFAALYRGMLRVPAENHPAPMAARPGVPRKLTLVLAAFAFAFGIGDAMTGGNMFSLISKVGMGIPELLVLLGVLFFYGRLDLKMLVTVASLLATAGLIGAFFLEEHATVSFILANAASEIYLIMCYAIACEVGHQVGCSSVFLAGLFAAVYKIFLQLGKAAGAFAAAQLPGNITILGLVVVLTTVAATVALLLDDDIVEKYSWQQQTTDPRNQVVARLAEEHALTPKEAGILPLLADGKSTAAIAEELFLSQSTIRVHLFNICRKMGVSTRDDLMRLIDQAVDA